MNTGIKLMILAAVILSDLVAMAIVTPQLIRRGQTIVIPILGGSIVVTTIAIAWVLFALVD